MEGNADPPFMAWENTFRRQTCKKPSTFLSLFAASGTLGHKHRSAPHHILNHRIGYYQQGCYVFLCFYSSLLAQNLYVHMHGAQLISFLLDSPVIICTLINSCGSHCAFYFYPQDRIWSKFTQVFKGIRVSVFYLDS